MKLLITGAQGMLGTALQKQCLLQKISYVGLGRQDCDITRLEDLSAAIEKHKPTHIINAAAYTKVDLAEKEQALTFLVNTLGAKNIAMICSKKSISLLQVSTDYVFDGQSTEPYSEVSPTSPLSIYGKSKAQGEIEVLKLCPTAKIVRLQALYGENGSHFVQTMLNLTERYSEIEVVTDQHTSPSYTQHIARALIELLEHPENGIFHLHNQGICSWYEFAKEIFKLAKNPTQVLPVTSEHFPRPAPRPLNAHLSMIRWQELGLTPLPHWTQALKIYLATQKQAH